MRSSASSSRSRHPGPTRQRLPERASEHERVRAGGDGAYRDPLQLEGEEHGGAVVVRAEQEADAAGPQLAGDEGERLPSERRQGGAGGHERRRRDVRGHVGNPPKPLGRFLPCHLVARTRETGANYSTCLLYTSDAADDLLCVDLGGRRIIK